MGIPPISHPISPHSPSLGRAGRGGSFYGRKDAVGPCRSPLTVVYLCNKWNIHRGAAVAARLHKSRGTQRAFQTSLKIQSVPDKEAGTSNLKRIKSLKIYFPKVLKNMYTIVNKFINLISCGVTIK